MIKSWRNTLTTFLDGPITSMFEMHLQLASVQRPVYSHPPSTHTGAAPRYTTPVYKRLSDSPWTSFHHCSDHWTHRHPCNPQRSLPPDKGLSVEWNVAVNCVWCWNSIFTRENESRTANRKLCLYFKFGNEHWYYWKPHSMKSTLFTYPILPTYSHFSELRI